MPDEAESPVGKGSPETMNQDNTIKSLIPETILEGIPSRKRVHFASRIVDFFKEANPDLYETIGGLDSLPDELKDECVVKVKEAALAAHSHYRDMVRQNGGEPEPEEE